MIKISESFVISDMELDWWLFGTRHHSFCILICTWERLPVLTLPLLRVLRGGSRHPPSVPLASRRISISSSAKGAAQLRDARRRRRRVDRPCSAPRRVDIKSKSGGRGRRRARAQIRFGEARVLAQKVAWAYVRGAVTGASRRPRAEPNAPLYVPGDVGMVGARAWRRGREPTRVGGGGIACWGWWQSSSGRRVVVNRDRDARGRDLPDSPRPLPIAGPEAATAGHPRRGTAGGSQESPEPPLAAGSVTAPRASAAALARPRRPGRRRGRASEPAPRTALAAAAWPRRARPAARASPTRSSALRRSPWRAECYKIAAARVAKADQERRVKRRLAPAGPFSPGRFAQAIRSLRRRYFRRRPPLLEPMRSSGYGVGGAYRPAYPPGHEGRTRSADDLTARESVEASDNRLTADRTSADSTSAEQLLSARERMEEFDRRNNSGVKRAPATSAPPSTPPAPRPKGGPPPATGATTDPAKDWDDLSDDYVYGGSSWWTAGLGQWRESRSPVVPQSAS